MKNQIFSFLMLFCLSLFVVGCSSDSGTSSGNSGNSDDIKIPGLGGLNEIVNDVKNAAEQLENGEAKPPVNFRKLKEQLPQSAGGYTLEKSSGESSGMGSMKYSVAKGTYKSGDGTIKVSIQDFGSYGAAIMGFAAWGLVDIDKESDDGYERTTKYKSHKAMQKYNTKRQTGSFEVIAGKRFLVKVEARKAPEASMKAVMDGIDLDALAALKPEE